MAESEEDGKVIAEEVFSGKVFKCCANKSSKTLVCVQCGNLYHLSCAIRQKLSCVKICETRIICCKKQNEQDNVPTSDNKTLEVEKLKGEIQLLKELSKEKDKKYELLIENNKLLVKNNHLLEEKIKYLSSQHEVKHKNSKKQSSTKTNIPTEIIYSSSSVEEEKKLPEKRNTNNPHQNKQEMGHQMKSAVELEFPTLTETENLRSIQLNTMDKVINLNSDSPEEFLTIGETENLRSVQLNTMENIINLNSDSTCSNHNNRWQLGNRKQYQKNKNSHQSDMITENMNTNNRTELSRAQIDNHQRIRNDEGKKVPGRKIRKQQMKIYGENETDDDFGVQRKVWLYLYRVKRQVTPEIIKNYVKNQIKFQTAEIEIKELPTQEHQNKCFMFGIDFKFKEEIYNPSTWPKSVAYKRFDFRIFNQYQRRTMDF